MSQQLVTSDRGYIELCKLQKLFGARFALSSAVDQLDTVSIDDVYRNDSIIAHVVLRPTDPEFDISLLKGESCINLSLCLHRVPGVSLESSHGYYTISQASDIDVKGDHLGRDVKLVLKKVILTFLGKYLTTTPYAIYECLKLVDRELCHIFEICGHSSKNTADSGPSKAQQPSGDTWSLEEQKSLEFALGKTKAVTNATERWSAVAAIVKTKTADECRLRFQRCREQLLNKANEHKKSLAGMPAEYQTVLARSDPLRLLSLELEAISVFNVVNIVVQLGCTRCSTAFDVTLAHGDRKTAVMSRHCDKCNMAQLVEFQPEIAFASQPALGNLKLENCIFLDYITGEYFVTCQSCDTQCKVRDVQNGTCKRSVCRGCFAKLALSFSAVEFGQDTSVSRVTSTRPIKIVPKPAKPKTPGGRGLKVGTPLPDNGVCKHYSKSFRWFRFPCCGKLFPCDLCHDEGTDHPYELAHVIVCGHCSTQQAVSNKKCQHCGRGYTASSSSYWEGGKGCRDAVKLSRKDSKKYGLLRKQAEQTQGTSRSTSGGPGRAIRK